MVRTSTLAAAAALVVATSAAGAPVPFQLVFDGGHRPATFPTRLGLEHAGPFTAGSPFCASGSAADVRHVFSPIAAFRRFVCSDNSGTITARVDFFPSEHVVGGTGGWQITEGTGQYATLRGKGIWKSVSVGGDPNDAASITFRTAWDGIVDFDNVAPTLAISRVTVVPLRRPARTFVLRITLRARDDGTTSVPFAVAARDGRYQLAAKTGRTSSGAASVSLRVTAPKGTKSVTVEATASDAVGNERKVVRAVALRRS